MPGINEGLQPPTNMAGSLRDGLQLISSDQTITFTQYVRVTSPLDGSAFWVRGDISNPPATGPLTRAVKGSLHYATDNLQDEAEGFGVNRVVFTSTEDIEELTTVNPRSLYIGTFDGQRFAFSRRSSLYKQSGLWHYQGDAVYPSMSTQIIDDASQLQLDQVTVSNSLPIWLTLNQFCPMYPSYLVPDNAAPPWCAVHIAPEGTRALQSAPYRDPATGTIWNLAEDRVRLTFYGIRNAAILDFLDYLLDFSINTDLIGIMDYPTVRDGKRAQAELTTLAQQKTIEVVVSYNQYRAQEVALQYILSALITLKV